MMKSVYAQLVVVFIGIIIISNLIFFVGLVMTTERTLISELHEKYPDMRQWASNFRRIMLRINLTSLLVGALLILLASKYIVRPVKSLSEATQKVSRGDFNVHIPENRQDELGQLIGNFNAMARELRSIEILRSDFVSAISHEFKTPLTSIKGYAKLLSEAEDRDERREYAQVVLEETERLSHLASNILLLNRLENEDAPLPREVFDLDEQIRRCILLLESLWTEKCIDLSVELGEIQYRGNEQLLYQVWLNVLDNAIKFSSHGGRIEVRLSASESQILVAVRDFGTGIAPIEQLHVFDKFFKADKSRTTQGNGLGLAIAKKVVDMHKGTIELNSVLGEGTTVSVRLLLTP